MADVRSDGLVDRGGASWMFVFAGEEITLDLQRAKARFLLAHRIKRSSVLSPEVLVVDIPRSTSLIERDELADFFTARLGSAHSDLL